MPAGWQRRTTSRNSGQQAYMARTMRWNDLSRGSSQWIEGADEEAEAIDLHPLRSGTKTDSEGLFLVQHRYWLDTLRQAVLHGEGI